MKYFDLQVNGYAGTDFNSDHLTPGQLNHSCSALKEDGVDGFLVTLITDEVELLATRMERIRQWREKDDLLRESIAGFHIEGPFINAAEGYRGAHLPEAVKPANRKDASRLLDAGGGLLKLFTLAPETDENFAVTRFFSRNDVVVSAGHCNPPTEVLERSIDAGLSMFTHVGNACPIELPRHDNIIERALSLSDRIWCCFIADGVHVPAFALSNWLKVTGIERAVIVTDAISAARMGPGQYQLGGIDLMIGEDLVARSTQKGLFAGSTATMPLMHKFMREELHLGEPEIERLVSTNPRSSLSL